MLLPPRLRMKRKGRTLEPSKWMRAGYPTACHVMDSWLSGSISTPPHLQEQLRFSMLHVACCNLIDSRSCTYQPGQKITAVAVKPLYTAVSAGE